MLLEKEEEKKNNNTTLLGASTNRPVFLSFPPLLDLSFTVGENRFQSNQAARKSWVEEGKEKEARYPIHNPDGYLLFKRFELCLCVCVYAWNHLGGEVFLGVPSRWVNNNSFFLPLEEEEKRKKKFKTLFSPCMDNKIVVRGLSLSLFPVIGVKTKQLHLLKGNIFFCKTTERIDC